MRLLSVQEFYKSPRAAMSSLSKNKNVVLTSKGKPSAFLIKTDCSNFEKLYTLLQQLEFMQAVTEVQEQSKKNGNSKMSLKKINTLIADARKST
jgi:hypothetical protein